ncbi:MAG TPA: hypothetical protein VM536_10490 [Chloroflexia bacterium]|nr:hypothetical protein [Chloroflexia bacterium]
MDTNANTLEQALGAIRSQFGNRLQASLRDGQVQMRRLVEQQLGLDELSADRVVKRLAETGRLTYAGGSGGGGGEVLRAPIGGAGRALGDPAVPPVAAMPGNSVAQTGGPLLVPLAPAVADGATHNASGERGGLVPGLNDEVDAGNAEGGAGGRSAAEESSGATMGQLADTSVESEETRSLGGDQGDGDDNGYWQIG